MLRHPFSDTLRVVHPDVRPPRAARAL